MNNSVRVFSTPFELAEKFAEEMVNMISETVKVRTPVCIALSGGTTPELLFSVIADHFSKSVKWENVHFFWGDERCVAPDDNESNYGMARRAMLQKITIPASNVHRIKGELEPVKESRRYSDEIAAYTQKRDGLPVFDLVILGMGEDGHTASIFPSNISLMDSESICEVASHPVSGQKRITLTGRVINNADRVTFLVTGRKKAAIVEKILNKKSSALNFPAARIVPVYGEMIWFLDKAAASLL